MHPIRSFRWWFEHRHTGEITIAQPPNWPLFVIAALWALRALVLDQDTGLYAASEWLSVGLWLFWGIDEIVRGVNPWRKVLGTVVVIWQLVNVFT